MADLSDKLMYVVGEDHPEEVFRRTINELDEKLPTAAQLTEWGLPDQIPALDAYQRVMYRYFSRVEEGGKRYLDGSKEIKFDESTEKVFWQEILDSVNGVYSIDPNLVDKVLEGLRKSERLLSRKKQLIKEYQPDVVYHEGIGIKDGKDTVFGIHSSSHVAAENIGARVVYLDEGFGPYLDPELNHWESQEGREEHWIGRVRENPFERLSLAFVGFDHIRGKQPGIPYIGEFLGLLEREGIPYQVVERLE